MTGPDVQAQIHHELVRNLAKASEAELLDAMRNAALVPAPPPRPPAPVVEQPLDFELTVQLPNTDGVFALTGERSDVTGCYVDDEAYAVYLPHSCDAWIVASGNAERAIAKIERLERELAAAKRLIRSHDNPTAYPPHG